MMEGGKGDNKVLSLRTERMELPFTEMESGTASYTGVSLKSPLDV